MLFFKRLMLGVTGLAICYPASADVKIRVANSIANTPWALQFWGDRDEDTNLILDLSCFQSYTSNTVRRRVSVLLPKDDFDVSVLQNKALPEEAKSDLSKNIKVTVELDIEQESSAFQKFSATYEGWNDQYVSFRLLQSDSDRIANQLKDALEGGKRIYRTYARVNNIYDKKLASYEAYTILDGSFQAMNKSGLALEVLRNACRS